MTRCIPSRIHYGQTEVFWELLARKPAAVTYVPQQQTQFLNSVGVSPLLLPEHTTFPAPPTLAQLLPPPPPLCPTPAPQQQIPFEEYDPDTTAYSLPQNNKRKKDTPTKVDDYHHESNTKQV